MKKKITILGGGLGSITTAMKLSEPQYQDKFDITIYQMGWRLGGKGASGRNLKKQSRIEEHGLHLWFGCYDHAFDVMKKCYTENNRPLTKPLATWQQAFKPHNFYVLTGQIENEWHKWEFDFPPNKQEPGLGGLQLSLWEKVVALSRFTLEVFKQHQNELKSKQKTRRKKQQKSVLRRTLRVYRKRRMRHMNFRQDTYHFFKHKVLNNIENEAWSTLLKQLIDFFERPIKTHKNIKTKGLIILLQAFQTQSNKLNKNWWGTNIDLYKAWVMANLAVTHLLGFFKDEIFDKGLQSINEYDYKEWLKKHGASDEVVNSPPINSIYSAFFSHHNSFEAGTAINLMMETILRYKGAFYYRMQAGMGDVVFTPMYEVLKKRGVKFKFFHKVEKLVMSQDQKTIERIEGGVQVNLKNSQKEYQPLVNIKDLPCWPSMPLYEQIVEGEELEAQNINLESAWTPWKNAASFSLQKGVDYDHLILGISLDALRGICADIIKAKSNWQQMMDKMLAVPTQATQLWFKPDVAGLGWRFWQKPPAFLSTYTDDPINTWADMSDLIIREEWTGEHSPNHIAYYCNEYLPDNYPKLPPSSNQKYLPNEIELMRQRVINSLNSNLKEIFPNAIRNDEFNWDLLVDPAENKGSDRLDSQYLRVNLDPTEHYVLSVKGSAKFRLKANESGFENMTLTGDWIDNEAKDGLMNGGFVEGTVLAGIRTSEVAIANLSKKTPKKLSLS
jgi:uncharacterized protein with NAD-binding domain and iron-sulfur cluster